MLTISIKGAVQSLEVCGMREPKTKLPFGNCDPNSFLSTFRKYRVVRLMRLMLAQTERS